jgi:ubiquinone/menaquinone biosynthesis C-methylase UbiE/DNA-binding MarR family transcriptional regulator
MARLSTNMLVTALKAAAEPTRLRILLLLAGGGLNVKDLTRILGQSQPRISRHLKLLSEAGLVGRAPEGSWVYFHLAQQPEARALVGHLLAALDPADAFWLRDRDRAEGVKRERETAAQTYFETKAADWDRIRALHVAEADVEAGVRAALRDLNIDLLVDLGTGTGRMLELTAEHYTRGLGFDRNPAMLAYARGKLERLNLTHAQIRQADIYELPLGDGAADAVIMHQILHFLSDPARAVTEAARIVAPGGRLVIVDFAPHQLEFLRDAHAHERLGFAAPTVAQWLGEAGLTLVETRHLTPPPDAAADKLTVSIWVAERHRAGAAPTKSAPRTLERTA